MGKRYYTLAVREDGRWGPQFGSYVRSEVEFERDDYRDHDVPARDLKIIATGDTQAEIEAGIAELNKEIE